MVLIKRLLPAAALLASGCAPHLPQTYRLSPEAAGHILTPPGVATPQTTQGIFTMSLAARPSCAPSADPIAARLRGARLRVEVSRDVLLKQSDGWLKHWAAEAESQGCIPPGASTDLALRILESVPLDPAAAYRLMHADNVRDGYVDLGPENRLQVSAPVMRAGVAADAPVVEIASVAGQGAQLNVDLRTTGNAIGIETSWYALRPRPSGVGATIVALSTERNIGGNIAPAPLKNFFEFAPQIGFYRMIYKVDAASQGSTTEIIVGATDRLELERRTKLVLSDSTQCKVSDPAFCAVIPREVAMNPFVAVTINGQETCLTVRSSIRSAIRAANGPRNPDEVLPQLSVLKPYAGKLVPVEFDRTKPAILDLVLLGGESITWK